MYEILEKRPDGTIVLMETTSIGVYGLMFLGLAKMLGYYGSKYNTEPLANFLYSIFSVLKHYQAIFYALPIVIVGILICLVFVPKIKVNKPLIILFGALSYPAILPLFGVWFLPMVTHDVTGEIVINHPVFDVIVFSLYILIVPNLAILLTVAVLFFGYVIIYSLFFDKESEKQKD